LAGAIDLPSSHKICHGKGIAMNESLRAEVVSLLRRKIDPDEYDAIRRLWMAHSIAEDKRDIPGLMATLTEDCVYTVMNNGVNWHGKEGATRF
jgi:hypothetical protein